MMNSSDPRMDVESQFVGVWTVEDLLGRASFCFAQPGNPEALV
jgi:hypothetical protein